MIPREKHLNFMDESISGIHCIKLTRAELHKLVLECPFPQFTERGASTYCAPMWDVEHKKIRKTGCIGFNKQSWYEIDEEESDGV